MINKDMLEQIDSKLKFLVSRACAAIYEHVNSQHVVNKPDNTSLEIVLKEMNRLAITEKVSDWFEKSAQYNRELKKTLEDVTDSSEAVEIFTAGDSYWSSWNLSGKIDYKHWHAHIISYDIASKLHASLILSADKQKINSCIHEAAIRCVLKQVTAAFNTFFSADKSLSALLSEKSPSSSTLYSEIESKHECSAKAPIQYTPSTTSGGGDETSEGTKVDTFSDGSNKHIWSRDSHMKTSEPFLQHLNNTATLHTHMMMTDLSESNIDSYHHARHSNTFDKLQTSSNFFSELTTLFTTTNGLSADNTISQQQNIDLQNSFLRHQVGNTSLIINDDSVATTRIETLSA